VTGNGRETLATGHCIIDSSHKLPVFPFTSSDATAHARLNRFCQGRRRRLATPCSRNPQHRNSDVDVVAVLHRFHRGRSVRSFISTATVRITNKKRYQRPVPTQHAAVLVITVISVTKVGGPESCKLPTKRIMGAPEINLPPNSPKWEISSPTFCIFGRKFSDNRTNHFFFLGGGIVRCTVEDTGNRAEWRRTRVADPSPEGFTA